jgi:hypothetical protein
LFDSAHFSEISKKKLYCGRILSNGDGISWELKENMMSLLLPPIGGI